MAGSSALQRSQSVRSASSGIYVITRNWRHISQGSIIPARHTHIRNLPGSSSPDPEPSPRQPLHPPSRWTFLCQSSDSQLELISAFFLGGLESTVSIWFFRLHWWRWRESNPRPKHSSKDFYRFSRAIWFGRGGSVRPNPVPCEPIVLGGLIGVQPPQLLSRLQPARDLRAPSACGRDPSRGSVQLRRRGPQGPVRSRS